MSAKVLLVVAIIVVIGLFYLLDISASPSVDLGSQGTVFKPVEIRTYQGERLSSINDFHENSIHGTQVVSKENYLLTVPGS